MMVRRCAICCVAWLAAACGTPPTGHSAGHPAGGPAASAAEAAAPAPPPATWKDAMLAVEGELDALRAALDAGPAGDLRTAAAAAARAAALMQLGYGPFEQPRVDGFAAMARDCESWLLGMALEARHGRAGLLREQLRAGEMHCVRCHEAGERVRW